MSDPIPFAKRKIVYRLPGMDEIEVVKDRPYKRVDDRELKFDVYRPPQSDLSHRLPVVVFVHGEGPPEVIENSKDWGQYDGWGRLIAASGMMAVTFNRRSSHFFSRLSDPAADVDDLLDHVLDPSKKLGADPEQLAIWTCSGGAPFGVRVGLKHGVRCIAAYYGRMSLKPIRDGIEGEVSEELMDEFSSVAHLRSMPTEGVPPIFIAKAELDDLVGVNESIDEAIEVARARNIPVTVANHPLAEHGMDVRNDDDRMREIIADTLEFFRRHLGLDVPE
jgi:acetyl esterase/lipase